MMPMVINLIGEEVFWALVSIAIGMLIGGPVVVGFILALRVVRIVKSAAKLWKAGATVGALVGAVVGYFMRTQIGPPPPPPPPPVVAVYLPVDFIAGMLRLQQDAYSATNLQQIDSSLDLWIRQQLSQHQQPVNLSVTVTFEEGVPGPLADVVIRSIMLHPQADFAGVSGQGAQP